MQPAPPSSIFRTQASWPQPLPLASPQPSVRPSGSKAKPSSTSVRTACRVIARVGGRTNHERFPGKSEWRTFLQPLATHERRRLISKEAPTVQWTSSRPPTSTPRCCAVRRLCPLAHCCCSAYSLLARSCRSSDRRVPTGGTRRSLHVAPAQVRSSVNQSRL